MELWNLESVKECVLNFDSLSKGEQQEFLDFMNEKFPPQIFKDQLSKRRNALGNMSSSRKMLQDAQQQFPPVINSNKISASPEDLKGFAIVFTAGGEGERLRLSLQKQNVDPADLKDFTKATFPIPRFYQKFGTLQTNLAMISSFCRSTGLTIPVIITTGPEGSVTARVIPAILQKYKNFGLSHILVAPQQERLHFSIDEKVVYKIENGKPIPVTQPDETGGPLMKLKQNRDTNDSILNWLKQLECKKLIIVQATALYNQELLPIMANALGNHDCLGVGIMRQEFPEKDPFGTFVSLIRNQDIKTVILEQDIRDEKTRTIKDGSGKFFLPFNTGFYALDSALLEKNDLPDFATPPKEIHPSLPRSPKIGYAATDLLPLADKPLILTINQEMFGVLKTAEDLDKLSELGKKFGLDKICESVVKIPV